MNINYKGKNFEVTPALKEHAEKKLSRLERIMDVDKVMVTLVDRKSKQNAEVTMTVKGYLLRAEVYAQDAYAAIDIVVDKLEKQLVKYKEKLQRKTKKDREKLADVAAALGAPVFNTGVNYVRELTYLDNLNAAVRFLR